MAGRLSPGRSVAMNFDDASPHSILVRALVVDENLDIITRCCARCRDRQTADLGEAKSMLVDGFDRHAVLLSGHESLRGVAKGASDVSVGSRK